MSRWTTLGLALAGAVLAAAVVVLGGVGGAVYWQHVELTGEQRTAATLPDMAREAVPKILGYDYQSVERSSVEALNLMTPEFRKKYQDMTTQNHIFENARQRQVISQVDVVGVGILSSHRDSGSVLAFVNRIITDKTKQPTYEGSRLRVEYQRIGGQWLINEMTPIF
jgi:Mce-associated membrane protein